MATIALLNNFIRCFQQRCLPYASNFQKTGRKQKIICRTDLSRFSNLLANYTGKGSFEGWMKRIFINTALEKFRKNRPLQLVEEFPDTETEDIEENVMIPEEVLTGFVDQLPEKYRLVFSLYVAEDMSHKEIAALAGITEGTSKSNLARAREILKRKVKEYLKHEQ